MKNLFTFCLFLFISTISFSQKQGLGLLPTQGILNITRSAGEGGQLLRTICVNGNLSAPNSGTVYRHVTGGDNVHFKVNGKDYPGGFQKAIEDDIIILETQGYESVKININPNKTDIVSIEIGVSKAVTVLSESPELSVENYFEEISNAFPEAWQDQYGFWDLEFRIDKLKKTGYLKNKIHSKTDLENAESIFSRDFPNESSLEVLWKQEQLNELGYFKQEGTLKESEKSFKNDFGDRTPLQVINIINSIEKFNRSNENTYPVFYINKSEVSGQYILFNKLDKPIYTGTDEFELEKTIEEVLNEHDNAFLSLNGFETLEKEAAFVSTLNIRNKTQGKNIYFNKIDMEQVAKESKVFSSWFQHKLYKNVERSSITSTEYNKQQYFKSDIYIESTDPSGRYDNEVAHVEALAKNKEVLGSLLDNISSVFKTFTENLSLSQYFNNFKKQLKKTQEIKSEDEFIIRLRKETLDLRIVENERNNQIIFSNN